jgi:hypothetical protein
MWRAFAIYVSYFPPYPCLNRLRMLHIELHPTRAWVFSTRYLLSYVSPMPNFSHLRKLLPTTSNTTDATSGPETSYPSGSDEVFLSHSCCSIYKLLCSFCRSALVFLSYFFWTFYCLLFFDWFTSSGYLFRRFSLHMFSYSQYLTKHIYKTEYYLQWSQLW